ncbi:MAG: GNAT family N-acetyltransferase [Legionella sp.]
MKIIIRFKNIFEFETTYLYARKLRVEDFELIASMYQNKSIMKTLGGVLSKQAIQEKFKWNLEQWENNGFGQWLWYDKKTKKFVGRGGLRKMELEKEAVVEIGYVLVPSFWNQGLATEMAIASKEIAFEVLNLKEAVCFTLVSNKASQRVMEKIGCIFDRQFIYQEEPHVLYRLHSNK